MLTIRLQRVGRKGYPVYRVVVQEARRHPSSGRVVAHVGNYNPHTKETGIKIEEIQKYLNNGAKPTPRVVKLLNDTDIKLPKWVEKVAPRKVKSVRHAGKLRQNQPKTDTSKTEAAEPESK